MEEKRYALKYELKVMDNEGKGYLRSEIGEDEGACQAIYFVRIHKPKDGEDGHFSIMDISYDGHNGLSRLGDADLFRVWTLMAGALAESSQLTWETDIANHTFEKIKEYLSEQI